MSLNRYRTEIDGLRGIAVLLVLFYHAGIMGFAGGWLGVDVFFLISGYLIARNLINDFERDRFSYRVFLIKRVRRILPLLVVFLFTLAVLNILLNYYDRQIDGAYSILSAQYFVSNIYFWLNTGYFETSSIVNPLLHTWSLSVEWQYYLIFPLLMVLWKFNKFLFAITFFLIFSLSLFLAQFGGNFHFSGELVDPVWKNFYFDNATFFLLLSRLWEFLLGVVCAFCEGRIPRKSGSIISLICVLVLLVCAQTFDYSVPSPSVFLAVPLLAATCFILFVSSNAFLYQTRLWKGLEKFGLISYSLYLWHFPILTYTRFYTENNPNISVLSFVLGVCFVVSYLSWKFIEEPCRKISFASNKKILTMLLGAMGLNTLVSLYAIHSEQVSEADFELISLIRPELPNNNECDYSSNKGFSLRNACVFGDVKSDEVRVVYGDSHASTLVYGLDQVYKMENIKGIYIGPFRYVDCIFIPTLILSGVSRGGEEFCVNWQNEVLNFLNETKPSQIVFAARWTYQLYPAGGAIESQYYNNGEGGVEVGIVHGLGRAIGKEGLQEVEMRQLVYNFLGQLAQRTDQFILVYPIPEMGWNIPDYNYRKYAVEGTVDDYISVDYQSYLKRNAFILNMLDSWKYQKNVIKVKPSEVLCNVIVDGRCVGQFDRKPLYFDDDHLSILGSNLIVQQIMQVEKAYGVNE